jgi:hypothetical protein
MMGSVSSYRTPIGNLISTRNLNNLFKAEVTRQSTRNFFTFDHPRTP